MKINKKLALFLFFIIQIFNSSSFGEYKNIDKTNNLDGVIKKKYSPTTTVKGNLFFTLGVLENSTSSESFHFTYENKIKLNTSFNETDNLLTIIESGNAMNSPLELDLQSKKGDNLKISTLLYKFKLYEKYEVIIGPKMFGYNGLAGKSTAYNERIAILDGSNYTTSTGIGPGIGISRKEKENGFNTSLKIASNRSHFNNESIHLISQIGLTKEFYGGTFTNNLNNEFNSYGISLFLKPNNFPSISTSIEYKDENSFTSKNWIFALQKNLQNKKIGIAVGTHNAYEQIGYEGWSEITITDKLRLIPVIFLRETSPTKKELGFSINTKFSY